MLEGGEHRGAIPCCSLIATGDSLIHTCPPAPEVGQIPLDRRARDRPEIVRTRDIALQRAAKTDYAGKADPGHPGSFRHADTGVCGVKTLRGCPDVGTPCKHGRRIAYRPDRPELRLAREIGRAHV